VEHLDREVVPRVGVVGWSVAGRARS
jgi:hypothetical protein